MTYKYKEKWVQELYRSNRYEVYRRYKQISEVEAYLYKVDKKIFRETLIKFRFGNTEMYIHKHRYEALAEKLCPLCQEEDEDEYHVIIHFFAS